MRHVLSPPQCIRMAHLDIFNLRSWTSKPIMTYVEIVSALTLNLTYFYYKLRKENEKKERKSRRKDGGCCCWPSVWQAHKRLPQAPLIGDEKPTAHRVGRKRPQAIASQGKRPCHTLELVMAGHGWANVWPRHECFDPISSHKALKSRGFKEGFLI